MTAMAHDGDTAPSDEATWRAFIEWLPSATITENPQPLFDNYRARLVEKGAIAAQADAQMALILRAMRTRPDGWRVMFNKIYASTTPGFSTQPSALLASAIEERKPGRALDVGAGQGRNAVFLAMKGWEVTGFDVSDGGLKIASRNAAAAGVVLRTEVNSIQAFDMGKARWDLIVITYEPAPLTSPGYVERLCEALRPNGLVVIESFASDATAAIRKPVDIDPAELLRSSSAFRILHFEDVVATPEWTKQKTRLARLVAQKPAGPQPPAVTGSRR
jgi:predicted O-methyltransferase YrrM